MKSYNLNQLTRIINGTLIGKGEEIINQIFFDSRMIINPIHGIFFAFHGNQKDGHHYLQDAYQKGIRNFVVEKAPTNFVDANFIEVKNPLNALQVWAKYHRKQFTFPVIGITCSNLKTFVYFFFI